MHFSIPWNYFFDNSFVQFSVLNATSKYCFRAVLYIVIFCKMRAKNYYFGLFISNLRNKKFEKYFSIMPKQIKKFWVYQSISFQNRPMGLYFNSSLKECWFSWFSWNKKSYFYINNIWFVFRSSILTHALEYQFIFPINIQKAFILILLLNFFLL